MTDIYQSVANKYKGSPSVVVLFLLSVFMFFIGLNHFIEDTNSSKLGLESIERAYNLNVQIFQWSYWTMSIAPQIATMVFMYMYLSDTSRYGNLAVSGAFQAMDFVADSWYRSNGHLFQDTGATAVSALLTFVYFSIGSEFFIATGGGLILKLFAPALATWNQLWSAIGAASEGKSTTDAQHPKQQGNHNGNRNGSQQGNPNKQKGSERRMELMNKYHGSDRRQNTQPRQQMGFQGRDLEKNPLTDEELAEKIEKLGYK